LLRLRHHGKDHTPQRLQSTPLRLPHTQQVGVDLGSGHNTTVEATPNKPPPVMPPTRPLRQRPRPPTTHPQPPHQAPPPAPTSGQPPGARLHNSKLAARQNP